MANRLDGVSSSASLEMKERLLRLASQGKSIIDLTIGEPDFATPPEIRRAAIEAIEKGRTRYTSARGIADLRREITTFNAKQHHSRRTVDEVIVTPGGKQGIFYALSAVLDEGEEVLIPEPAWVSFGDLTKLAGGVPKFIPSREAEGFVPPVEKIKANIGKRTRAVLINNPTNPTGAFYDRDYIEELFELCRETGIFLISDEVYSDIIFDGRRFFSALEFDDAKVVVINSFSKSAAMTGWRLGYVSGDLGVIDRCIKMQQQTATCPSSVAQYAALAAFKNRDNYLPKMVAEYRKRRDALVEGIQSIGKLGCFIPKGTFYLFVNVKKLGMDSEKAAEFFLERAGVAMLPGSAFGRSGEGYLRLSFATSEKNLVDALGRMRKVLG